MWVEMKRRPYCTLSSYLSTCLKDSLFNLFFISHSLWLIFLFSNFDFPSGFLPPTLCLVSSSISFLYCRFAYSSPLCQLYSPLSHFFLDYIFLFKYYSHIVPLIFALLFPLNFNISASSTSSSLHLLLSISPIQLYDLGSPADSQSSSPGCLTTDSSCVNMGYPSCGHRGRCHGEWGSFSCQCVPGYTGHQCEEGELNLFLFIYLFFALVYLRIISKLC